MEKEAVEWFEAAKKAGIVAVNTRSNAEESRCLDALTQLKNLPVTYQILLKTQVGKRLQFLTKFPNKKIKHSANDVIKTWKSRIVIPDRESPTKPVMEEIQPKSHAPRFIIRYKRPLPECDDEFRNSVRERIYDCLYKICGADGEERKKVRACDPLQVALSMESFLFQEWSTDNNMKIKFRTLLSTISHPENSEVRKQVLFGQITATHIAGLSAKGISIMGFKISENAKKIMKTKRSRSTNRFNCNR